MGQEAFRRIMRGLRRRFPRLVEDGPVSSDYWKPGARILWIQKEVDSPHSKKEKSRGWSLSEFLSEIAEGKDPYPRWTSTYRKVLEVSYGILNGMPAYPDLPKLDDLRNVLRRIAVINLFKQTGGCGTVSHGSLKVKCAPFLPFVAKQVRSLKPRIVIGGYTLGLLKDSLGLRRHSATSALDVYSDGESRTLYLDAYHPGVRAHRQSPGSYYGGILSKARGARIGTPRSRRAEPPRD
jgi:hypothetical protein